MRKLSVTHNTISYCKWLWFSNIISRTLQDTSNAYRIPFLMRLLWTESTSMLLFFEPIVKLFEDRALNGCLTMSGKDGKWYTKDKLLKKHDITNLFETVITCGQQSQGSIPKFLVFTTRPDWLTYEIVKEIQRNTCLQHIIQRKQME